MDCLDLSQILERTFQLVPITIYLIEPFPRVERMSPVHQVPAGKNRTCPKILETEEGEGTLPSQSLDVSSTAKAVRESNLVDINHHHSRSPAPVIRSPAAIRWWVASPRTCAPIRRPMLRPAVAASALPSEDISYWRARRRPRLSPVSGGSRPRFAARAAIILVANYNLQYILFAFPLVEGAFLETSLKRSGVRCLRVRLVTGLPGSSRDQPGR